eukprot:13049848-Heterocapsa_arctica.AAC.1
MENAVLRNVEKEAGNVPGANDSPQPTWDGRGWSELNVWQGKRRTARIGVPVSTAGNGFREQPVRWLRESSRLTTRPSSSKTRESP